MLGGYVRDSELEEAAFGAWQEEELGVVIVVLEEAILAGEEELGVRRPVVESISFQDVFALIEFIVPVENDQVLDLVVVVGDGLGGVPE